MNRKIIGSLFLLLAVFCAARVQAAEKLQISAPDAVVKELYRVHNQGNGALLDRKSRAQLNKFFDGQLFNLLWKELTSNSDEVGNLDFDPFYNAQDIQITGFTVGRPVMTQNRATVAVTFRNGGRRERLNFKLNRVGKSWKVANVVYADGSDLVKILSAPLN